ncbi:2246_t:CDS:2, partial [Racocetra fulgida]
DKKPIYQLLIANDDNTHKFYDYLTPDQQTEGIVVEERGRVGSDSEKVLAEVLNRIKHAVIRDAVGFDSRQPLIRHHDIHKSNESPIEHHDSSYRSHDDSQLYPSSLEKRSPITDNQASNENKEILESPSVLHDHNREQLQNQPLIDTEEYHEHRNSYENRENRELVEKKDSIENQESSNQNNELLKTSATLHDCHREPLQRMPLTHAISTEERRNSYEDVNLHDEGMDSDVSEDFAQSRSPRTRRRSISNTETQITKFESTSPPNKGESFSSGSENSQNLAEDIDPDADPWDAPDYYESSQIANNESSYPEDQSEYWEENEHVESSESSEAALDSNLITEPVKREINQHEELQESEASIQQDQLQIRKSQQHRIFVRENQLPIISHQDSRYIMQQDQSQTQKLQQHRSSIHENPQIVPPRSRPQILQRQSESRIPMQHIQPRLQRIPDTLSIQEIKPIMQRSQSLTREHRIYSQHLPKIYPIQPTQYPMQEIQRTSNRQLQEFQESGKFPERTEWEPNIGIEIPETNNNSNSLPYRPIIRRHTFSSNDNTNIQNTRRQAINPYSLQLSSSPIDITSP